MNNKEKVEKEAQKLTSEAAKVFTPAQPITDPRLFSGREDLIRTLRNYLSVVGTNFVLYGERGVGKTSFCNILFKDYQVHRYNCSKQDDFVTIFLNILSTLGLQFTESERRILAETGYTVGDAKIFSASSKVGFEETEKSIEQQRLNLAFVLDKFGSIPTKLDAIILDEFQNIENPNIQTYIIEVIKGLSDRNIGTKIVIVGIGSSDEDLLSSPEYPQFKLRHVVAYKIPKMTLGELKDIIEKREALFKIKFGETEKEWIAQISSGYPSYAHKLALQSISNWIWRNASRLTKNLFFKLINLFSPGHEIERIDINVSTADLEASIRFFVQEFRNSNSKVFSQLLGVIRSEDQDAIQLLLLMAKDYSEYVTIHEMSAQLKEAELKKIIKTKLNLILERAHKDRYRLKNSQLRATIRCWEYIEQESQPLYSELFEKVANQN